MVVGGRGAGIAFCLYEAQTVVNRALFRVGQSIAAVVAAALLGACGGDAGGADDNPQDPKACATDDPATAEDLELLPPGLPLDEWGTVVKISLRRGFVGAEAISDMTIVDLYSEIGRAVRDGDYVTISGENEGFEAELFFQKGPDTGTFLLRKGPCRGQVTIKLIYGSTPERKSPGG